jgi:PhzF family phenazine biosynthesis protein
VSHDAEVLRYSAFAATPEGGNPAGVVLDASALDDATMQRIAAEVGYSETAFLLSRSDGDAGGDGGIPRYGVRYWSPAAEVPFCGHATVATAVALAERDGPGTTVFDTIAGPVTMRSTIDEEGVITISFTSVEPQLRDLDPDVRDRLLGLLGLEITDLDDRYPAREAFAGNWHPILVLADRELFHQFRFAPADVAHLMREQGWLGTVTVLHAAGPTEFEARNLFPVGRITEDPATGSAAASTGAYLRELGFAGSTIRIRQGAHVGRPSLLTVTIPESGGIVVSGGAVPIG